MKLTIVEWYNFEQFYPGIAYSSDGRVRVAQGDWIVILPAPAADILKDSWTRQAVKNQYEAHN